MGSDPVQRAARSLAAAQAKVQAGAFEAAVKLLGTAEAAPLDEFQLARVDLLRAQLAFAANRGSDAPPLLLKAAKRLEPTDVDFARETYLDALNAALFAGRLASPGAPPARLRACPAAAHRRRGRWVLHCARQWPGRSPVRCVVRAGR
jgi:outer membrane PBP1 activator LpoA protein